MISIAGIPLKTIIEKTPEIVQAAISEKNRERFEQLIENAGEMKDETMAFIEQINHDAGLCAKLVIDLLRDPLAAAGFTIGDEEINGDKTRSLIEAEMEMFLISELKKLKK